MYAKVFVHKDHFCVNIARDFYHSKCSKYRLTVFLYNICADFYPFPTFIFIRTSMYIRTTE